ncbi:MAG: hypothetical protein ABSH20_03100, partial [Tepidisphaeraceae bacterium]
MGQRANLILVENGQYRIFYSHWCAASMTRDFFWGPDWAKIFISVQEPCKDLLDEIWAEGGAVLDRDARTLLLFGGEEEMSQVPVRRLYMALLRCVWKGWDVQWAQEGVADLADRIGYPQEKVRCWDREELKKVVLEPRTLSGWASVVGSARMPDGSIHLYPLMARVLDYLWPGTRLLDAVVEYPGVPALNLGESTDTHPAGGFHLDLIERVVEFWTARPAVD